MYKYTLWTGSRAQEVQPNTADSSSKNGNYTEKMASQQLPTNVSKLLSF
jgi:hypothetical protein